MKKEAGILMPVLSLPNPYGCGDFGKEAYQFVDRIADIGFKIWQILPLQPLGYGASPYQPYSSKAMDELYISLDLLKEWGLIQEVEPFNDKTERISYQEVREYRTKYLWEAFYTYEGEDDFWRFASQKWVDDYAIYLTLKKKHELRSWQEWDEEEQFYPERRNLDLSEYETDILYEKFVQYVLHVQWEMLRKYANEKNVKIMGDVPFYVGLDSSDVWWNKDMFLLDKKGKPTSIAGVPPDYFSATGQRWGNPIYDWEALEKDNFYFWIDRLSFAADMYDIVRIDHFRAFSSYWKVKAECKTAIDGVWVKAPGYKFFDELYRQYPDIQIVAEDLGDNMKDAYALRDHYGLKGMTIVQFSMDGHYYGDCRENQICYTGTHDNMPISAWYKKLKPKHRKEVLKGLKKAKAVNVDVVDAINSFAMTRSASTVILPMCDILRLGEEGRINTPGLLDEKNWSWRMVDFKAFDKEAKRLHKLIVRTKRI
ncbi:MAG: 4-alpha-glucanotransferase [Erysipelotrichaceae bacterium]|nr:4-alpha-glucanotransferase [Erysipelotrichaceae bacterium]